MGFELLFDLASDLELFEELKPVVPDLDLSSVFDKFLPGEYFGDNDLHLFPVNNILVLLPCLVSSEELLDQTDCLGLELFSFERVFLPDQMHSYHTLDQNHCLYGFVPLDSEVLTS